METPNKGPGRARGRARARSQPLGDQSSPESQAGDVGPIRDTELERLAMAKVFEDKRKDSDSSSNGHGSNGDKDSNGNGSNGSNGENGSSRGGSPRGMSPRSDPPQASPIPDNGTSYDFIASRPSAEFVKTVELKPNHVTANIISNYYMMKTHPNWNMSLYAVKVSPPVDDEKLIRKLVFSVKEQIGSYLLTGLQLFTTKLIQGETEYTIQFDDAAQPYNLALDFKRTVPDSEAIVMQFYNLIIRSLQQKMKYQPLGRHFFDPTQARDFPSFRLRLWPGFQNSIRQQEKGLMLNVESVWKVTQTDSMHVLMENIRRQNPENYQTAINEQMKDVMVVTTYGRAGKTRIYKIDHVDFNTSPMSTFPTKNGEEVYVNYYKNKYGIDIRDRRQAMLVSLPKERDIRRGQTGNILLVPELCHPCGLNDQLRSNFRLMKEIACCLHMPPTERVQTMNDFIRGVASNAEIIENLKNWGLKILDINPLAFQARFMPPDEIVMADGKKVKPDDKADWTMGFRGNKMLASKSLSNWALVSTTRDSKDVNNLISTMQKVATPLGFAIRQPTLHRVADARGLEGGVRKAIAEAGGDLDLVMIILVNNNADVYAKVKRCCTVDFGVPSQCFLAKNMTSKGLMSIATKVVIQINAKQGGLPWGVSNPLKSKQVMVLGYDVHHTGAAKAGDSIGAMCATVDASLGLCFSTVSKLSSNQEVATSVAALFAKCLDAFKFRNGCLPERIMMYRDGVGEGQLKAVYNQEIKAFKDCIRTKYNGGEEAPKLTFVVVNKRINTRFFQKMPNGQFQNPRPGLIVDDVVTRPERYDFYLVSQTARQGCVSPTYYNVLEDEAGMPPERLQMFTWKLCHMYYNWSGTVSVPGPCQNAHKLAFQVGTAIRKPGNRKLEYQLHFL